MKLPLKTSMTALLLWSVAVLPAATVSYVATADLAHAKSDNAGGNGNGNGNGNGASSSSKDSGKSSNAGGKSKSSASSTKSTGSGSSAKTTRASGNDPVGRMIDRVLGREKKKSVQTKTVQRKAAPAKTKTAVARSKAPKVRPNTDPMHASNLGNMNGALNANVNAVLAHIKNGNTNGPVGHLAALAIANVNAEGAQEVVDLKQDFVDLQTALDGTPYETVQEYYEALEGVDPIIIDEIDTAVAALATASTSQETLNNALAATPYATVDDYLNAVAGGEYDADSTLDAAIAGYSDPSVAQDDLNTALTNNGYEGDTALSDYQTDREGVEGIDEITEVSDAIEVLGGNVEERADITATEPSDEDVAGAEDDLAAQDGAEVAILDYWNKNTDTDPAISDEEQALLDKLNERLDADAAAIAAAVGAEDPEMSEEVIDEEEPEVAECEADDEGCTPADAQEEIAVVVE